MNNAPIGFENLEHQMFSKEDGMSAVSNTIRDAWSKGASNDEMARIAGKEDLEEILSNKKLRIAMKNCAAALTVIPLEEQAAMADDDSQARQIHHEGLNDISIDAFNAARESFQKIDFSSSKMAESLSNLLEQSIQTDHALIQATSDQAKYNVAAANKISNLTVDEMFKENNLAREEIKELKKELKNECKEDKSKLYLIMSVVGILCGVGLLTLPFAAGYAAYKADKRDELKTQMLKEQATINKNKTAIAEQASGVNSTKAAENVRKSIKEMTNNAIKDSNSVELSASVKDQVSKIMKKVNPSAVVAVEAARLVQAKPSALGGASRRNTSARRNLP